MEMEKKEGGTEGGRQAGADGTYRQEGGER